MGLEATCRVTFGSQQSVGRAHLDSSELTFAGDFRLRIPFTTIRAFEAKGGALRVTFTDGAAASGTAAFELGPQAEKWALKIRYPRSRIEKLGIKPTSIVSVIGIDDDGFHEELQGQAATISKGRVKRGSDFILFGLTAFDQLERLAALREQIVPAGAIWAVWPKGRKELREDDVRRIAVKEGLVDVKVMSFSDTLSALKLVIPVAKRPAVAKPKAAAAPRAAATKTTAKRTRARAV